MYPPTADFLYRSEVQRDKPIGYWPLDRDMFAQDFRAAAPNPGTYNGTVYPAPGPFGSGSRSVGFDGSTGYVDTPTQSVSGAFAIEAWAYKTSAGAMTIMGRSSPTGFPQDFYLRIDSGSGFLNAGETAFREVPVPDCSLNVWHHHALTFDGANLIYYLDGFPNQIFATTDVPLNNAYDLQIGRLDGTNGIYWQGLLAHVAVYSYGLAPSRIAAHAKIRARSPRRFSFTPRAPAPRPVPPPAEESPPFQPRHYLLGLPSFRLARSLVGPPLLIEERLYRQPLHPIFIDYGRRYSAARSLYRIFNAAGYSFYRSTTGPPLETSSPFATSATLPDTPSNTFADGVWYLSASYFNGVLSSGFLPLGPQGQTYLLLELSGGTAVGARPSGPSAINLQVRAGGVIRINAFYLSTPDGPTNAANTWAIAYTTDGSTPPINTPSLTQAMTLGALQILAYDLPAQATGTTVTVQLQTRRGGAGGVYSFPSVPAAAIADATGPSQPLALSAWVGGLPDGES